MARLKGAGTSFLYVSHRLEEVLQISDRITVLRNGRVTGDMATEGVSKDRLIALITGRTTAQMAQESGAPRVDARDAPPLLDVRHLATRDGRVVDASLTLRAGEVVGLFGLAGAGRTELVEALYGLRPRLSGEVLLRGMPLGRLSPRRGMRARMAMLSEDRGRHGLVARHSVRDNMTLQTIGAYTRFGLIRRRLERRVVRAQIEQFAIKTQGEGQLVDTLSGGNQQKVLLARMLLLEPRILLCDEPTHAVDVGTRQLIHRLLIDRARAGCGVLFVSSDLTEVLEVADRVVVMGAGRTVATALHGEIDAAEMLRLCYEAEDERGSAHEDANAG